MHKPECVLENKTHKIIWDFEIQIDHLILARKTDLGKEYLPLGKFGCFSKLQSETKRKQKERQIHVSCQRGGKTMEQEGDSDTNCR